MITTVIKAERHTGSQSLWVKHELLDGRQVLCFTAKKHLARRFAGEEARPVAAMLAKSNPGWVFVTETA
jgi:hypothetical protein